jgi:GNAT superfamily N-acetyltransferase
VPPIATRPLDRGDFPVVERLFGARGAVGGCWCMHWRVRGRDWEAVKGEPNRRAFRALVESGAATGVLAFDGETPVGWAQLGPKASFARIATSKVLATEDDPGLWCVNCFFVPPKQRRRGVAAALLAAALDHARARGATALEAYPARPGSPDAPGAFVWTGVPRLFEGAGFRDVSTRDAGKRIYRLDLACAPRP